MSEMIDLLEAELEAAFEVKDKKSLHRYVVLMVDNFAMRQREEERFKQTMNAFDGLRREMKDEFAQVHDDIRLIAERMEHGFKRVDERFEAVDKRFEDLTARFEARFDANDKRFDANDKRFEAVDKRFEDLTARFEARFDANDKRFGAVDKRFDDMNKRFSQMFALVSLFFTLLAGLITAFGLT